MTSSLLLNTAHEVGIKRTCIGRRTLKVTLGLNFVIKNMQFFSDAEEATKVISTFSYLMNLAVLAQTSNHVLLHTWQLYRQRSYRSKSFTD